MQPTVQIHREEIKMKLIYIACKDEKEAKKIADALVEKKLAACINIFPINSIFRWKDKMNNEKEIGMFIKTREELVDEVIKTVKELHSYETPCIITLKVEKGNKDFLDWVEKETKNCI